MSISIYSKLATPASELAAAATVTSNHNSAPATADQQARASAKQFEALLIHTMLKNMRAADTNSSLLNSDSIELYKDMFDQQISREISNNGSFGLADVIYRQLIGDKPNESAKNGIRRSAETLPTLYNNPGTKTLTAINTPYDQPFITQTGTPEHFIRRIGNYAKSVANKLGTSTEAVIAIAALETGWGKRIPLNPDGSSTNNLFGIKADNSWDGKQTIARTTEFRAGTSTKELASFRSYPNEKQSVEDFANFLESNPRYKKALATAADSEIFLHELQHAGYATDPNYANKVFHIVKQLRNNLEH